MTFIRTLLIEGWQYRAPLALICFAVVFVFVYLDRWLND